MKKVLLIISGRDFPKGTFEFARQLNEINPILLSGFFLPEIVNPAYEIHPINTGKDEGEKIMEKNIKLFSELCDKNKIEYRIHLGTYELCMPQLLRETRFSDLFIAGSDFFYRNYDDESSQPYLNKTLHESECPIIIVPEEFKFPENIIMAYDGSAASVYAIKQFAYLFPELCLKSVLLIYNNSNTDSALPDSTEIKELAAAHFSHIKYLTLKTDKAKDFSTWVADKERSLLVIGAYSRSALSEIIRKSFSKEIITEKKIPVFISHS